MRLTNRVRSAARRLGAAAGADRSAARADRSAPRADRSAARADRSAARADRSTPGFRFALPLIACALIIVCALLAAGLRPAASPSLLADPDSPAGRATPQQERAFGDEPIAIVVAGDLATRTLVGENLLRLLALEGKAARLPGVRSVYGPGTFLNSALVQIEQVVRHELGPAAKSADRAARRAVARARARGRSAEQAAALGEAARVRALGPLADEYRSLLVRLGAVGLPSLSNRAFVLTVALGADGQPKQRFRWLFPDARHALVIVRPEAGLSDGQQRTLGRRLQALAAHAGMSDDVKLRVAGVPLVVAAIADSFRGELLRLAPVVLLGLMLALLAGFRGRRRRLRLLVLAGGAVLATAAGSRLFGLGLTPATIAALPVVLGLAVDYGVQLQARFWAELGAQRAAAPGAGASGAPGSGVVSGSGVRSGSGAAAAARRARAALAPTLTLAALAMAAGFGALALSPVPLLDRLAATLAIGTLLALAVVLAFGPALLAWRGAGAPAAPALRVPARFARLPANPGWLAALAIFAATGLLLANGTRVQSDLQSLAPRGLDELAAVQAVERELGTGGVLRLAVTGRDVLDPVVLDWQRRAAERALETDRRLRPGPNVAELLGEQSVPSRQNVDNLLRIVPRYFLDAVVTRDRRRGELSFSVPTVSVAEQAKILARVQDAMGVPPRGVALEPAGLIARGVQSVKDLEAARPVLLLVALAVVAALLLAVRRDLGRALVPLVPTLLAAGLSALLLRVSGLELSPLGAGLEPLVLAVGVEFGLLLEARYAEARATGLDPSRAQAEAVSRVGAAVGISALTVAVGFAALAISRMELLQQFGLLVAAEVLLCAGLAIWLVAPLAAWAEGRRVQLPRRSAPRERTRTLFRRAAGVRR